MKSILTILAVLATSFGTIAQTTTNSEAELNAQWEMALAKKTIPGVELGTLMCEDANGNMVICSGDEFEKVLGFATSIPYVTVNKRPKGQNQDTFEGKASLAGGEISEGDYVCAGPNGTVKRCEKIDFPYGKALSGASGENQTITVRVLGTRR